MPISFKHISTGAASLGSVAAVCVEAAYTPESPQKWALVLGISAAAGLRLYLFSEGSALMEISPKDAKRAFKLSVILSGALIIYGFFIKFARGPESGDFPAYAFYLFLLLQTALPFTEWVFSKRLGAKSSFYINVLKRKRASAIRAALYYRSGAQRARLELSKALKQVNTLISEKAAQAARLERLEAIEAAQVPPPQKVMGAPVAICPECYRAGRLEIVTGGPNSKSLKCSHNHNLTLNK